MIFRTTNLESAWHLYSGLAVLPSARMPSRAWILGVGMLAVAALGLIGVVILVQLGGDETYDFIYFRF